MPPRGAPRWRLGAALRSCLLCTALRTLTCLCSTPHSLLELKVSLPFCPAPPFSPGDTSGASGGAVYSLPIPRAAIGRVRAGKVRRREHSPHEHRPAGPELPHFHRASRAERLAQLTGPQQAGAARSEALKQARRHRRNRHPPAESPRPRPRRRRRQRPFFGGREHILDRGSPGATLQTRTRSRRNILREGQHVLLRGLPPVVCGIDGGLAVVFHVSGEPPAGGDQRSRPVRKHGATHGGHLLPQRELPLPEEPRR